MSAVRWNATVVDSPDSDPYTIVGDLLLAVRTPRSRDFVTVEVGPAARCRQRLAMPGGVSRTPEPYPRLTARWQGEVHTGDTVDFQVEGNSYHLTLARLAESPAGFPWVTCQFSLERD
jgi:hypothetical protein